MPDARFSEDFWTDPKIRALDHDTQRLFIYLFTNPHRNYCGLYYLPKAFMREQTGLSDRSIDRGIDTLSDGGLIEYSEGYQMVFVKSMLKRQAPGYLNAKQIKGIENHLNRLHGCPLIKSFLETYSSLNLTVSYTPIHTPMDVQSQSKSQSQSQSQYRKENASPPSEDSGDALLVFTCRHFEVSDGYFKEMIKDYPGFSEDMLKLELKKMRDWLDDNSNKHKRTSKGFLKSPKNFIRNWLSRAIIAPGGGNNGYRQGVGGNFGRSSGVGQTKGFRQIPAPSGAEANKRAGKETIIIERFPEPKKEEKQPG